MSKHRHRNRRGGLKTEHKIIPGCKQILQTIASHPKVRLVIPGEIHQARHSQSTRIKLVYDTDTGVKCRLYSGPLVQEVFVVGCREAVSRVIQNLNSA